MSSQKIDGGDEGRKSVTSRSNLSWMSARLVRNLWVPTFLRFKTRKVKTVFPRSFQFFFLFFTIVDRFLFQRGCSYIVHFNTETYPPQLMSCDLTCTPLHLRSGLRHQFVRHTKFGVGNERPECEEIDIYFVKLMWYGLKGRSRSSDIRIKCVT